MGWSQRIEGKERNIQGFALGKKGARVYTLELPLEEAKRKK